MVDLDANILKTIKKLTNLGEDDDSFDLDVLTHINTVFMTLYQLGVGPVEGFAANEDSKWQEFTSNEVLLNAVKSYIGLRVRLLFDPPATSFTQESFQRQIDQLEWRLMVLVDPPLVKTGRVSDD